MAYVITGVPVVWEGRISILPWRWTFSRSGYLPPVAVAERWRSRSRTVARLVAYVAMARIGMAFIVVAYIVMAYICHGLYSHGPYSHGTYGDGLYSHASEKLRVGLMSSAEAM